MKIKTIFTFFLFFFFPYSSIFAEDVFWNDWEVLGSSAFKNTLRRKKDGHEVKSLFEIRKILQKISDRGSSTEEIRSAIRENDLQAARLYGMLARYSMTSTKAEDAMQFLRSEYNRLKKVSSCLNSSDLRELEKNLSSYFSDMNYPSYREIHLFLSRVSEAKNEAEFNSLREGIEKLDFPEAKAVFFFWKMAKSVPLSESEKKDYLSAKKDLDFEILEVLECMECLDLKNQSAIHAYKLYSYASMGMSLSLPTTRGVAYYLGDYKTGTFFSYLSYKLRPHSKDRLDDLYYILVYLLGAYEDSEAATLAGFIESDLKEHDYNWDKREKFLGLRDRLERRMKSSRFEEFFSKGKKLYAEQGVYENSFFEDRFRILISPYDLDSKED